MIDDKTPNLQLPLPHEDNLLEDDVNRLRAALTLVDTEVKTAGTKAAWATVSGKPATFPPATHAHAYADVTGKPGTFPPATHAHAYADVTGKPATFPPATHAASHAPGGADVLTVFSGLLTEKVQNRAAISGAVTVDLTAGHYVVATVGGAVTLTLSGAVAGGCTTVLLELTNGGKYSVTWGMTPKWPNGAAPTLTANGVDLVALVTRGDDWRGVLVASNVR